MIILMGIKHSGKTSLGKLLAKDLNLPFLDLDILIEEQYSKDRKLNFREIYLKLGEQGFKNLEIDAMASIFMNTRGVLALGGGTIDNPKAMEYAKNASVLVFLDTDEQILYKRIKKNGFPSFLEKSPEKLFHDLFIRRRELYSGIATITMGIHDECHEELLSKTLKLIEDYR